MKKLIVFLFGSCLLFSCQAANAAEKEIISSNNEYGGETVEITTEDYSFIRIYYDADYSKVKEETIFTEDYPVNNGLRRLIIYYSFDKKIKEERIYSNSLTQNTKIRKSIDYYDRFTGLKEKSENHFAKPYSGYNVIYKNNEAITRIEWYYPENIDGISHNIVYFDKNGMGTKVESFYTEKTSKENGYFKRIYYNEYSPDNYFRKKRQEWYYTNDFSVLNNGKFKMIQNFYYPPGESTKIETHFFDKEGQEVF